MVLIVKKLPANAGDIRDAGLIPGGRHGNSLQYSCLENPKDRGAWQATVYRVIKRRTRLKQLSTHRTAQHSIMCALTCYQHLKQNEIDGQVF